MTASPTSSTRPGGRPSTAEENPELLKFREEWLAELQQRKRVSKAAVVNQSAGSSKLETPGKETHPGALQFLVELNLVQGTSGLSSSSATASGRSTHTPAYLATHPALNNGEIQQPSHGSTVLERALDLYRRAVEHEQKSELDEALLLYRQAFRLVRSLNLHDYQIAYLNPRFSTGG